MTMNANAIPPVVQAVASQEALEPIAGSLSLVRVPANDYRLALEPNNFREAQSLAAMVSKSGMFASKDALLSPESALVRIMTGRALGLPTFIALMHIYDVYGRPALSSRLKISLCMRLPEFEYFDHISSDNNQATYRAKRKGRPEIERKFTLEQAKTAQLVKKDSNWEKWPHRMLQARASGELADLLFPEATMGLPNLEEAADGLGRADVERAEELRGEVVSGGYPTQAGPARDFDAEVADLRKRLTGCTTDLEKKTWRTDAAKLGKEAGDPWAGEIKTMWATLATETGKAAPAAASSSTTAPAASAPQGEPDLFRGAR